MRPSFTKAAAVKTFLIACMLSVLPYGSSVSASASHSSSSSLSKKINNLEIGAFNIQVFGESKVNKPLIRQTLLSILSRYDIIFIQEIRDDKNQAIYSLLKELNSSTGRNFHALVSKRMGRGEMKEQYAYFFDADRVEAVDSYVYDDKLDEFAREPYVARFRGLGREFSIAGIHVAPTAVHQELTAMGKVYKDVKKRFADNNLFILGDFNADCIYYKPAALGFDFFDEAPRLLITDDMDTTVSPNSCAYDRIFGFGDIQDFVDEARTFNFMDEYGFDLASAKLVSDHFPIEFTLSGDELNPASLPGELISETAGNSCGQETYWTQAGYCYGVFDSGKKRVAESCCP